ncbi:MAG TPA: TIGR00300 family protein [Fimbriiglobus sp.]|jgi:lysine-ketoglutarate reductase/saccharopine dehydrogenase-like protein (TIGR00300 family)
MPAKPPAVEHVEMTGHIVDSLLLPKVLDAILARGGRYHIAEFRLGEKQDDPSYAKIEIKADSAAKLDAILAEIHPHGAVPANPADAALVVADVAAAFPERFYCSTNFRTQVRVKGEWVDVQDQEMDCGIVVDPVAKTARIVPMTDIRLGDKVVVGRAGTRVFPPEAETRKHELFEFMASPVSSERPKAVSVREIAQAMRKAKAAGEKNMAVLGPAVVHTGGGEHVVKLIKLGFLDVLFAGNALAAHDMEQSFYGTSLGVSLDKGLPTDEGHEHHLRTINSIRRLGGIVTAVHQKKLKSGIMFECVTRKIPFVLCGSIRDDGPIPEVITDVIRAQAEMRKHIPGTGFCLMVASTLHSIAVGNLLPASIKVACIDISPATVTKLMDRGSTQTVGIVSDAEPFLGALVAELERAAK